VIETCGAAQAGDHLQLATHSVVLSVCSVPLTLIDARSSRTLMVLHLPKCVLLVVGLLVLTLRVLPVVWEPM